MLKILIKKNIILLFTLPLFLNFILNVFQEKRYLYLFNTTNFIPIFSALLGSLFFYLLAKTLSHTFQLNSYSLSITYFLLSYFVFDSLLLPVTKLFDFDVMVLTVSIAWLLIFIKKDIYSSFKIFLIFLFWRYYNFYYFSKLSDTSSYQELNLDVTYQWYVIAEMIYENNYFYGIKNNLIEGQGLVPSFIQSLLLEIGFHSQNFVFIQSLSNIFLFFGITIITDLNITTKNKIILSALFIVFLLNNQWLGYLLINSLMIEGVVGFLVCVFLLNYKKYIYENNNLSKVFFLFFGCLALTKNFASIICLFLVFINLIFIKKNRAFLFGPIIFISYILYQKIFLSNIQQLAYTNEINFKNLILDILLLRNLNISNIGEIFKELYVDKPLTYLICVFVFVNIYDAIKHKIEISTELLILFFVIFNFLLIVLLYISYWQDIEVASSYRYIVVCYNLIFVSTGIQLSKIENIKS